MSTNKSVQLNAYPTGYPVPGENLVVKVVPFAADLQEGDVLLRNLWLSLDPYMRGRMNGSKKSYTPPFALNESLVGGGVSEVVESKNPAFPVGSIVTGFIGWEEKTKVTGAAGLRVIADARTSKIPLSYYIGALGMPGMTAYSSLYEIGKPKAGEAIFISAASGAVGQLVGQIAKHLGLRVIGSAGSKEKVDYLINDLKFDAAFNYKEGNILENLRAAAPNGIDIYYENVGGEQLEAALEVLNTHGRIVCCGMISVYNLAPGETPYNVKNLFQIIGKRLTMRGFIVSDFAAQYGAAFAKDVATWLLKGEMIYKEDVAEGLDAAPEAFVGMLRGKNFGKQVVKIADL